MDSIGILPDEGSVYEQFLENICMKDGRYQVQLPGKETHPLLPDNYNICVNRLQSLLHRLRKDDNLLHKNDQIIREQLDLGIIEHVDLSVPKEVNQIHHLPHHGIIRQGKDTTKLRIVYDASARPSPSQPSLNDCLYSGPSFNEQVMDVLMRFHCHRVALVSDVEKAFLMVSVEEKDQDCLRFVD